MYDYGSVMHYGKRTFAKKPFLSTLVVGNIICYRVEYLFILSLTTQNKNSSNLDLS